ncbi:MAG: hypothetical protein ACRDZR_12135 [Acidimicrobiales bacterium]
MVDRGAVAGGVAGFAKDAAYVVVGLGVLGYQRAQVQRVALERRLGEDVPVEAWLDEVRTAVLHGARCVDDALEHAVELVESTVQPLEDQLPPQARDLAGKAHTGVRQVREHLRGVMGSAGWPGGTPAV